MKHTPTPWKIAGDSGNDGEAEVIEAAGRTVAWTANTYNADLDEGQTTDEDRANGKLIVTAVNAHDALVLALQQIEERLHKAANGEGTVKGLTLGELKAICRQVRDGARGVLAKIAPEPPITNLSVRRTVRLAIQKGECIDRATNEVNITQLAENVAHDFNHDEWLDDETHFIWDEAANAAEYFKGYTRGREDSQRR